MIGMRTLVLATATSFIALAGPAAAQEQAQPNQPNVAEQCLADLRTFATDLSEEQFWLTGWGYPSGYGWNIARPGAGPVDPTVRDADPAVATADDSLRPWMGSPWNVTGVTGSPRNELRVLYAAAQVLGFQGKQEGCDYLLSEMQTMHDNYVKQLEEAGVDPAEITSWRQERIALAEPVSEIPDTVTLTVDYLQGTDVRNPEDEYLGSVSDVVLDRNTGEIEYVVVARGGFLGIGEDNIPVPWEQFSIALGLNTLVVDSSAAEFEDAPTVAQVEDADERYRDVNEYWSG